MMKLYGQLGLWGLMVLQAPAAQADSYRYMHVTIDTPWMIFVVLMFAVLLPFILMAVLYWRQALRREGENEADEQQK